MDCRRLLLLVAIAALAALSGCAIDVEPPTDGPPDATDPDPVPGTGTVGPDDGIRVSVIDVVDGDTIDVRYANGSTDTVRLLGVDSPEVRGDNRPAEFEGVPDTEAGAACLRDAGADASEFAERRLAGETVTLVVDPRADRRGDYGRLLAYVHVDGADFNYDLIATGNARVYDSAFSRSDRYYAAESEAQASRTALWGCRSPETSDGGVGGEALATSDAGLALEAVHADAAGNDHENLNDEYVVFRNAGAGALDLSGWTVSDDADHAYAFPSGFALAPEERVALRTGAGEDANATLYWGRDSVVWNNGGDTVLVANASGETVLVHSYGDGNASLARRHASARRDDRGASRVEAART